MSPELRIALAYILLIVGVVAVLIWAVSFGVRSALGHREKEMSGPSLRRRKIPKAMKHPGVRGQDISYPEQRREK